MKKTVAFTSILFLLSIGYLVFFWTKDRVVTVDSSTAMNADAVPVKSFEKSVATSVDDWRGRTFAIRLRNKEFRLISKECFVTPCGQGKSLRFLTIHSEPVSLEKLALVHKQFCNVFDAADQEMNFVDWSKGKKDTLFSANKFDASRVYSFSVHRTFDDISPWFIAFELAWQCEAE